MTHVPASPAACALCSIGINGCSLKTEDNLEVMAAVPLDRLLLETDCPWCEIRPSHAGKRGCSCCSWIWEEGTGRPAPRPQARLRQGFAALSEPGQARAAVPAHAAAHNLAPASLPLSCAGSRYVTSKFEAKDRKKYEAGKLVKSRNEPCCIAQARRAGPWPCGDGKIYL